MRKTALITSALAALALAGCASTGGATAAGAPSSVPSSEPAAAASSASPSAQMCTTHACIASGMEKSLPGIVADDGSVLTKAACKAATAHRNPNGSYTVTCVATYSDGSQWRGYGTLLNGKVYFQPVTEVR